MTAPALDVVVFGATSFVGQLLCRYLLQAFGTPGRPGTRPLRWAIAGRSRGKLDALLAELGVGENEVPVFVADSHDEAALAEMTRSARVVVSTVGPYARYGDALVKICTATGTDYCDLTGEAHWVGRMIAAREAAAFASGARIVPCCGFDSIPSDLGVLYLQRQAMQRFGAPCVEVKMRVKALRGGASGGTVASMLGIVDEATRDPAVRRFYADPYALSIGANLPPPPDTRQRQVKGAAFDDDFQTWVAPFVMAAINTRVVLRSHALAGYPGGAAFRYDEAMMTGRGLRGRLRAAGLGAGLAGFLVGAAMPPTRWLMEKTVLPAPGSGPSPAAQEKGFWDCRFIGRTADGRALRIKVTGDRDPGYGSTAKMLGEAAVCLARDVPKEKLPGGFWTPATAMGDALLTRLTQHAGLTFAVIE